MTRRVIELVVAVMLSAGVTFVATSKTHQEVATVRLIPASAHRAVSGAGTPRVAELTLFVPKAYCPR